MAIKYEDQEMKPKKSKKIEQHEEDSLVDITEESVMDSITEEIVLSEEIPEVKQLTKKEEKEILKKLIHPSRIKVKKTKVPNMKVISKPKKKLYNMF